MKRNSGTLIPAKLEPGDELRVVSPATSLGFIPMDQRETAHELLAGLGLRVSYSENGEITDRFDTSPVEARISDLHEAFADPEVKGVITTLGGYNSNQLLSRLDYDLIRENPKIFCGYSDITALATAIYAKTGLVTYHGPHFSTFAMKRGIEYTTAMFERCLMREGPYRVEQADHWSDDAWYEDQDKRDFVPNSVLRVIVEGEAEGTLLGGHLLTFCLLLGTPYAPDLAGKILLLECDEETGPEHLDRELQSLILRPDFEGVRGILLGRFQRESRIEPDVLDEIITSKPALRRIPVVADASFGHTTPHFAFPIGSRGALQAADGAATLTIEEH